MRIAIIVRSLKYGGMERAACNQADAFYQSGHKVDLIYFTEKNKAITPREKGVNVHFFNINKDLKSTFGGILWDIFSRIVNIFFRRSYSLIKGIFLSNIFKNKLNKLESDDKFDLILIRGQGTFEQIWKYKDPRSVKICVNVSTKNTSSLSDKIMSKCYFENANVNCNSVGGKDYYDEKLKRENVNYLSLKAIKNPFFKEKIILQSKEENSEIPKEPYILGLGRLVPAKNFNLLLDAYIILKEKYDFKYKLVLVGDGSQKDFLKNKCKKFNIENDVFFAGYQTNPYNWMAASEALILTSNFEGLCGVLIEAMACQTRIVANDCPGGVRELMSGKLNSNIVKQDPNEIALKLIDVLNKDKNEYYKDYDNVLSSLLPSNIVKEWTNSYVNKD